MGSSAVLFARYSSFTCFTNFPVFLELLLPYWERCLIHVLYPGSLLHSLPFQLFFLSSRASWHYFCTPAEMFCGRILHFDIDNAVFLCDVFHIFLHPRFHSMDILLLWLPFFFPLQFLFLFYHPLYLFFNPSATLPNFFFNHPVTSYHWTLQGSYNTPRAWSQKTV